MIQTPESAHVGIDPVTITLIGGQIILLVTTIGNIILSVVTSARVSTVKEQQNVNTSNLLTVAKDTEAIKGHVNSEKTASEGREAMRVQENQMLREMLEERRTTAALLAQASAQRQRPAAREITDTPSGSNHPIQVEVINTPETPVPTTTTVVNTPDTPVPTIITDK